MERTITFVKKANKVLAKGSYNALIGWTQVRETKSGLGQMLVIRFDVSSESTVWCNIPIRHLNKKYQATGMVLLGQLMAAVDARPIDMKNAQWLLNKKVKIKVKISPARTDPETGEMFAERNEVIAFERFSAGSPQA